MPAGPWRGTVLCVCLLPLLAQASAPLRPLAETAGDAVRAVPSKRGAIIEITSPDGIGRMTVPSPVRGAWPAPLRLRLRHAPGRPFRTLEGLDVSVDGSTVSTRESMRVEAGRGWLEVVVPTDALRTGKPLRVQWVDAYRR